MFLFELKDPRNLLISNLVSFLFFYELKVGGFPWRFFDSLILPKSFQPYHRCFLQLRNGCPTMLQPLGKMDWNKSPQKKLAIKNKKPSPSIPSPSISPKSPSPKCALVDVLPFPSASTHPAPSSLLPPSWGALLASPSAHPKRSYSPRFGILGT